MNIKPKHEIKNTLHKNMKSKQTLLCKDNEITKTNERIPKYVQITCLTKQKEKTIRKKSINIFS